MPNMGIMNSADGTPGYFSRMKSGVGSAARGIGNGMAYGASGALGLINPATYMRGGRRTRRRGRRAGQGYAADDQAAYY
jgi:hypothetical protein